MQKQILGGAVLAALVAGGVLVAPVTATAATTTAPAAATASTAAAAPFITVTTPEAFIPSMQVTVRGTATPNADVYITMRGANVINERVRSDAQGNWSYTPDEVLSGNLGGNSATVATPDGRWAQATFDLTGTYPTPTHADAAFRPITVTSTVRTAAETVRVSGTATPGALVIVRTAGWAQGVTTADAAGRWSTSITEAHLIGEGAWPNETVAHQQHASGWSKTAFVLPN